MDINSYALNLAFNLTSNADGVLGRVNDLLSSINDQINQASKAANSAFNFTGATNNASAINSGLGRINLSLNSMTGSANIFADDMNDISDITTHLNRQFKESEETLTMWERAVKKTKSGFAATTATVTGIVAALVPYAEAWHNVIALQEEFSVGSRMLYGNQNDMIKQISRLSFEYKVYGKEGQEAYVRVLDELRFTDQMIKELAGSQAEFNKATQDTEYRLKIAQTGLKRYAEQAGQVSRVSGAAVETVVNWQKAVSAIGFEFKDTQKVMNGMVNAMKAAGLTANDITKILNQQSDAAMDLNLVWGKDGTKGIMEYQNVVAAAFKKINLDPAQATKSLEKIFTTLEPLAYLQGKGIEEAVADGYTRSDAMTKGTEANRVAYMYALDKEFAKITKQVKGMSQESRKVALEAYGKALGLDANSMMQITHAYEELGTITKKGLEKYLGANFKNEDALAQEYEKSRNTIYAKSEQFWTGIVNAWQLITVQAAPYIGKFLDMIMPITTVLGDVSMWLDDFNKQATSMTWPQYFGELFRTLGLKIKDAGDASNKVLPFIGDLVMKMGDTMEWVLTEAPIWWDYLYSSIQAGIEWLTPIFNGFVDFLVWGFGELKWWAEFFGSVWEQTWPMVVSGFNAVVVGATALWDTGVSMFNALTTAVNQFIPSWDTLEKWWTGSLSVISTAINGVLNFFSPITSMFKGVLSGAKAMFTGIGSVLRNFWNSLKSVWKGITGGTQAVVQKAIEDANKATSKSLDASMNDATKAVHAATAASKDQASQFKKNQNELQAAIAKRDSDMLANSEKQAVQIDVSRLNAAADAKRKALESSLASSNPWQKALDSANTTNLENKVQETAKTMVDVVAGPKMDLDEFIEKRMRGMQEWTNYDYINGRAVRIETKQQQPQLAQQPERTESLKPPISSISQDDKMSKRRSDNEQSRIMTENVRTMKDMANNLSKDAGSKDMLQKILEVLQEIRELQGRSKNSIGSSQVTEWQ